MFLLKWIAPLSFLVLVPGFAMAQLPEDQPQGPALSPEESQKQFAVVEPLEWRSLLAEPIVKQPLMCTFDSRGRLWVVQYLQYPEPAGIKALSRDNFWRIVYDQMPKPPGQGGVPGADKITIYEDRDGDGIYETETLFVDGLNIATSVVPTEQGAWVLNPPYLLFYKDSNGDSKADGPPEVHLEGFGLEDTHSVVNSLCMGPDGWLYAAQGSTVSGAVRRFGEKEAPWKTLGQAIWRYHPTLHRYEVFAEGGGNAFGVAFDDQGRVFSGHNGGDTRGFHYMQGGYYRKGFNKHGSLSNPFAFGYLDPMKHDPIQRFTHTMLMTNGTALQEQMPDGLLCVDPLHGKLIQTQLIPRGATFDTKDIQDSVSSKDKWFRPVAIQDGPDGAAYVCDWYDFQVAHIYAHVGKMDRDHGRIYRLGANTPFASELKWDPEKARGTNEETLNYLIDKLSHPFRWQRWQARRLISNHPLRESGIARIRKLLESPEQPSLDALWTAYACGWLFASSDKAQIDTLGLLRHPNSHVRAWVVRLACDIDDPSENFLEGIQRLAAIEQDPMVLCQLACSAKRLSTDHSLQLLARMLQRPLPVDDLFLPKMLWWGVERHADHTVQVQEQLLVDDKVWQNPFTRQTIAPNLIHRWSKQATKSSMQGVVDVLQRIAKLNSELRSDAGKFANEGFERAFEGKPLIGIPKGVIEGLIAIGQPSLSLRLRQGDTAAIQEVDKLLDDVAQPAAKRIQLLRILGEVPNEKSISILLRIATRQDIGVDVRSAAISSLASFDKPELADSLVKQWNSLSSDLRSVVGAVLATRKSWTQRWLQSCESKEVTPEEMPMEAVRAMRMLPDDELQKRLNQFYQAFGSIDLSAAQIKSQELSKVIMSGNGDPYVGKKIFKTNCARCHKLFDQGGEVGPDLTGYQRDQLPSLLLNVVAPNLEIREGFQTVLINTADGQTLNGFIESQTESEVILRSIDGQSHSIERSDVDSMKTQPLSLMPEGLLDNLSPQELCDIMAYLRSSQPLSDGT